MAEISVREPYELYLDTVGKCTSDVSNRSGEQIEYDLFEEFVVGAHSYLHEDSLARLRDAGFIDDEMVELSKDVRGRWLALEKEAWTAEDIKSNAEWQKLFESCDHLMLKAKQIEGHQPL